MIPAWETEFKGKEQTAFGENKRTSTSFLFPEIIRRRHLLFGLAQNGEIKMREQNNISWNRGHEGKGKKRMALAVITGRRADRRNPMGEDQVKGEESS